MSNIRFAAYMAAIAVMDAAVVVLRPAPREAWLMFAVTLLTWMHGVGQDATAPQRDVRSSDG